MDHLEKRQEEEMDSQDVRDPRLHLPDRDPCGPSQTLTPGPQPLPCTSWMVKLLSWEPGASPDPGTGHISHFRRPNSNQERRCIRKRADILPGTYLMCQFSYGCFIADLASNSMNVVPVNNMENEHGNEHTVNFPRTWDVDLLSFHSRGFRSCFKSPKMEEFFIYRFGLEVACRADQILTKFFPFFKIL